MSAARRGELIRVVITTFIYLTMMNSHDIGADGDAHGNCLEPYRMMVQFCWFLCFAPTKTEGKQRHNSGHFRCFCVRRTHGARGFPPLTRLQPLIIHSKNSKNSDGAARRV
jgi:hypothetical protein